MTYARPMPTLRSIKREVQSLKPAQQRRLAAWLLQRTKAVTDEDLLFAVAAAGALHLDEEEARHAQPPKSR